MNHRFLHPAALAFALFGVASLPAQPTSPSSPAPADGEEVITLDKFTVEDRITNPAVAIGTDRTRNSISITREALLAAPAGISGLKMLESLPGFNVQTSDALGLYEFGNSVSVRAFNYQQIGFILDGVPMGRSDQFGGSPIYRYVDNENLGSVAASQGTGEVSQPSYASLGPIASYSTIVPAAVASVTVSATVGSNDLERTFIKAQSGEWNGFSAYLSRSLQSSDQWRGPGTFDREHWEVKLRYALSNRATLQFSAIFNDYFDFDSPTISKAQYDGRANDLFGRSGRYFGYLEYVPDLAPLTTAPTIAYSNAAYNQYYQQAINSRTDALYSLNGDFDVTDALKLTFTGYFEDKEGYGVSPEAYATSLANYNAQRSILSGLVAPKGLQYGLSTVDGERTGASLAARYKAGRPEFIAGIWVENDDFHRTQNRYNQVGGNPAGQPLLNENVHRQRDFTSTRDTVQLHAKATFPFVEDRLKVELGVKALDIDYEISGYRNPADYINQRKPTITDNWSDEFLPQIGLVYALSGTDQLFASYAENFALPRGADDIFALASPAAPGPDAETSENVEVGFRTNRGEFNAVVAVYFTSFENRLQSFASPVPGSTTTETFFQNVGGVESSGVEVSGGYRPAFLGSKLALTSSLTYNRVEFQDNYATFAIAGKSVPDSPQWISQNTVTYSPLSWAVLSVSAKYLSDRYTNFINSEMVGGYTLLSTYLDLGGDSLAVGPLKGIKVRFNVDNVTDKDYFGTISTTTNTAATFRPLPDRTFQVTVTASF